MSIVRFDDSVPLSRRQVTRSTFVWAALLAIGVITVATGLLRLVMTGGPGPQLQPIATAAPIHSPAVATVGVSAVPAILPRPTTPTASSAPTAAPTRIPPALPSSKVAPVSVRDGITLSLLAIEPRQSNISGDILSVSFAFTNQTERASLVRFNYDEIALSDDTRRSYSSGTYSGSLTGNFVLIESKHGETSFSLAPGETTTLTQYFRGTISPRATKMMVSFGMISASGPSFTFAWPLF